ncbi:MAG: peptidylprolyl isomerase [Spirochaetia bacterium]|nr:peptidylprolyl isomerase [Spirochaetia bacterium]
MKTFYIAAALLLTFSSLLAQTPRAPAGAKVVEEIFFSVNDEIITRLDYLEQEKIMKQVLQRTREANPAFPVPQNVPIMVISNMIMNILIRQEATKSGVSVSALDVSNRLRDLARANRMNSLEELAQVLPNEGYTFESFFENIRNQMYLEQLMGRIITVTEPSLPEITAYYEKNKEKEFAVKNGLFRVSQIFFELTEGMSFSDRLALKRKAEGVLKEIKDGLAFEKAAAKYSDDLTSKGSGGDMGWISQNEMDDPDFAAAIKNLKKGELGPLVSAVRGFYIVKLVDKKDSGTISFDKASIRIKNYLTGLRRQEALEKKMELVKARSLIQNRTSFFGKYQF